ISLPCGSPTALASHSCIKNGHFWCALWALSSGVHSSHSFACTNSKSNRTRPPLPPQFPLVCDLPLISIFSFSLLPARLYIYLNFVIFLLNFRAIYPNHYFWNG